MTELWIDIETYSTVDLREASVYRYVESPVFQIILAGWALDDGPVQMCETAADIDAIPGLWDADVVNVRWAHNAQFERVCFSRFAYLQAWNGPDAEWPLFMPPGMWRDSMALAAENGLPQSLDKLGKALEGELKDSAGTALVNWFCKPDRNGKRRMPADHPEKWEAFVEYCRQDVVTMRDAVRRMRPLHPAEQRLWEVDQAINDRGIKVDDVMCRRAVRAADNNRMEQELEMWALTGVDNPNSVTRLLEWFHSVGMPLVNLRAETVQKALDGPVEPPAGRVLELRQELALVASKKYLAALNGMSGDGVLRGQFRFFGAHTGRWAGRGVQLQNLPQRGTIKLDDDQIAEAIDRLKRDRAMDAVMLKSLVRSMFVGPFDVFDYSSIEARVIAGIAGEDWALDAFRLGRDIYTETAERMGGLTRAEGKIAVLALGYNGGINSLKALGGGSLGDDKALQKLVTQWRKANPAIVSLWGDLQNAFKRGGPVGVGVVEVEKDGRDRLLRLPSGRAIVYRDVRVTQSEGPYGMRERLTFADPRTGARGDTYGGRLAENITQGVARDVLGDALVRLEDAGHRVAAHVHDEVIVYADGRADEIEQLMSTAPEWWPDLPIAAEGFHAPRYRKG